MATSEKTSKSQIVSDFKKYINMTQAIFLNSVGLDIIESMRNGVFFEDIEGEGKYIDCFCSAGSFNVGRRNPEMVAALEKALDEYDMGEYIFPSRPKVELAELLGQIAPGDLDYVMLTSGGGEANDTALKLARAVTGKKGVLSLEKGYHGHTGYSLSAIGKDVYREPFEPLMPEFSHEPKMNDLESVRKAVTDDTAAIILELVQGEAGIFVSTQEFVKGLRQLCDDNGIVLIFDEVQTGFGRTGKMFCCEHYGIQPDIMTLAKSLSGTLYPVSAVIYNERVNEFVQQNPCLIESTSGGSDVGCRVGLSVIKFLIENDVPGNAERMGDYISENIEKLSKKYPGLLKEVRRLGLMIGFEYTHDFMGPLMSYNLAENGVLAIFSGNNHKVMRLMPPLVINKEEADMLIRALDKSMAAVMRSTGIIDFASKIPLINKAMDVQEMQVGIIFLAKTFKKLIPGKSRSSHR